MMIYFFLKIVIWASRHAGAPTRTMVRLCAPRAVALSAPAPAHIRYAHIGRARPLPSLSRRAASLARLVAQKIKRFFLSIHKYPLPTLKSQKKAL